MAGGLGYPAASQYPPQQVECLREEVELSECSQSEGLAEEGVGGRSAVMVGRAPVQPENWESLQREPRVISPVTQGERYNNP